MKNPTNFKSPLATNSTTLTDVYLRAMLGPKGGLRDSDAPPARPPAKPIELDYPAIATNPEFAAELDKLNRFAKERSEAEAKLTTLHEQIASANTKKAKPTDEDAIAKAESLLAGEEHGVNLQAEIQATNKLFEALRNAIDAQHVVLRRVTRELSQAAGRRYAQEHKDRVKRMMAAVIELHAANNAEIDLHSDLSRLGYTGEALPPMRLNNVEDPTDANGNMTYYWFLQAQQYAKTDAELAAGVRQARAASMLADAAGG